jgi:prepilin-type processing-associated H-X9-DG protein/prepilin-type N-terminal cleavage/methylation domain-containing protein
MYLPADHAAKPRAWTFSNPRAFTLVELLLVIAVIALLAALLLPALSRAKGAARSAACKSNLHQIGIGLRMYVDDFKRYPSRVVYSSFALMGAEGIPKDWPLALEPYLPVQQKIFLCPENDNSLLRVDWPHTDSPNSFTPKGRYGHNAFGTAVHYPELNLGLGRGWQSGADFVFKEVAESTIVKPTDMIAFGDAKGPLGTVISPIRASGLIPSTRHNDGSNILFCDGHIEFAKQQTLIEETGHRRRRWNNDAEPHPETW